MKALFFHWLTTSERLLSLFFAAVASALAPIQGVIYSILTLVVFDLVSGILAARKRGEKITSAKMKATPVKLFLYQAATISAFILDTWIIQLPDHLCLRVVAGVIGTVEMLSICENLNTVTGVDVLTKLKDVLAPKK